MRPDLRRPLVPSRHRGGLILLSGLLAGLLGGCAGEAVPTESAAVPSIQTANARGTVTRINFLPFAIPVDITPDGGVALLEDLGSRFGDLYFYNTATGSLTRKTNIGYTGADLATAISQNLRIAAFRGDGIEAEVYNEGRWGTLGSPFPSGCGANLSSAWDISADGSVVVGMGWNGCDTQAFRWTPGARFSLLQLLGNSPTGGLPSNRATVVSDDGQIAAGWAETDLADRYPAVWHADGSGFMLPLFPGGFADAPGEVLSISTDGSMVAGTWGFDGFTWTAAQGTATLGRLPGTSPSDPIYPNAIAADGQLVFGGTGSPFFTIPKAFVWTAAGGMQKLADVAVANGIVLPSDYRLTNVLAASTDGTVVLGVAYDQGNRQISFVLQLPVSAYGI